MTREEEMMSSSPCPMAATPPRNPYKTPSPYGEVHHIDPRVLNPDVVYQGALRGQSVEDLFPDEPTRTWGDRMCFNIGAAATLGAPMGGALGLLRGMWLAEKGLSTKLLLNRAVNGIRDGTSLVGNTGGMMGLYVTGMLFGLSYLRDEEDALQMGVAGALSGAAWAAGRLGRRLPLRMARGCLAGGAFGVGLYYAFHLWSKRDP